MTQSGTITKPFDEFPEVSDWDAVVIGGGPNGLICAAYLAKAGMKVALVERRFEVGGGLSTEEILFPCYYSNVHVIYHMMVDYMPALRDFNLDKHAINWVKPNSQTAMVFEWPSLWKLANSSESSKVQGEVGLAPMPKIERIAGIGGDEGLAVSAFSKKKEAGLELLKFIASEEVNRENTLRVGWLPVQKSLMDDPEIRNNEILGPMINVAMVQNQYYMDRFAAPYSNEVANEALGIAIVDAVNGKRSIADALVWAEQKSKEIVAKYNLVPASSPMARRPSVPGAASIQTSAKAGTTR